MNSSSEPGSSSRPGGTPIDDRIIAALASVASHIEVAPRSFELQAARRHHGRSTHPARASLRWVAVAALIAGVSGMMAMAREPARDDVVVAGMSSEDENSPVDFEPPSDGTIDPAFLHFVAPVNGDERQLAERLFIDGSAWARAKTITECLERSGLTDAESTWTLAVTNWYAGHGSPTEARLPALRVLAEDGLDRPYQDAVSRKVSSAIERCSEIDSSKASQWQRDIAPLQKEFAGSIDEVIAAVEAGPAWDGVRRCLTDAGAPAEDDRGRPRTNIKGYIDWLTEEQSSARSGGNGPQGATAPGGGDDEGSSESRTFARCATPFYAEVERALVGPREAFVEEHRHELLRLQADFASFA